MDTFDKSKACYILNDDKVLKNMWSREWDEAWDLKKFKNRCRIAIVKMEGHEMEFDIVGIHAAFANAFRRIMLNHVPTMAIEKVHIMNNNTVIADEILAHRLGMVPLKADPRQFEMKADSSADSTEQDTLEFSLKIKCTMNKDANTDSSRAEDMYKNSTVYSKHIKWTPIGNQKNNLKEEDVGPVHDDILLTKMRPGHELDIKLIAVKGIGRDHTKFSPVCTAFYRLLPKIYLQREVEGEAAERLQKCFSPGVIGIREENGRQCAFVKDSRYDATSRNVYKHEDLKDAVIITKVPDHYIFTIESAGALRPDEIFLESVKILKNKCLSLLEELNNLQSNMTE